MSMDQDDSLPRSLSLEKVEEVAMQMEEIRSRHCNKSEIKTKDHIFKFSKKKTHS